jgi:CO/xanthine dehydrogenase FAD-binding subunit
MALSRFEYFAPERVEEASKLMMEVGDGAFLMAGGTDLLVKINHRLIRPRAIIGLKKINGLDAIAYDREKGLTIGATALLDDVATQPDIKREYPAIAYAASETANVQIRNMGTVAGNLCNAAPSADNAPSLLAMNAQVTLFSGRGERKLPIDRFFKGPGITHMRLEEILTAIFIPKPPPRSGVSYKHISPRGKVDISAACVAVMVTLYGQTCKEVRIALGGVAPTPMRAIKTEELIRGEKLTESLLGRAAVQASKESKPISDVRATAEYRREMVKVLTKRALAEAHQMAMKR